MNIEDLNNKIYGENVLREGENCNYKIQEIEEQVIGKIDYRNFNDITPQIKF